MSGPILSIVIANYNYGRFLEEAIQSVLVQEVGDWAELIVVDGGSTDNSVESIKKYEDKIAWWVSEKDKGQSDAFNKGFSHARGKFLMWINADDVLTRGALTAVRREIERHPACEWFVGSTVWTDENLKVRKCFCAHRFSTLRARWGFLSAGGPSSFFTKRLLEDAGGFDVSLHYMMDTDLWYRFYRKCGAKYRRTRHNVWAYRQHEASKMSGADDNITALALENRRKSIAERKLLDQRYGPRDGWKARFAHLFSMSIADCVVAKIRTIKWKGRYATEI